MIRNYASLGIILAAGAIALPGQSLVMSLPRQSQRATVSQRVALTDITIAYHRPLAGGRKIWGGLAPYGQVWRAGANENTTIEFSDPVTVEGRPLATFPLKIQKGASLQKRLSSPRPDGELWKVWGVVGN
jgi:hypothetical protein